MTLPPGLTVNPDAADGQTMCTEAEANFRSEGPANARTTLRSVPSRSAPRASTGGCKAPSNRGTKPGDQYRLFEIASGFGSTPSSSARSNPTRKRVR